MSSRRRSLRAVLLTVVLVAAVGAATAAAGVDTGSAVRFKPVIGKLSSAPRQPVAGRRFTVSFRVTRSDTGGPLASGTMLCAPTVAGRTIAHTESFARGTGRLSLVVPATAAGRRLTVKITIRAGGGAVTKVASFVVRQPQLPELSIADAVAAETNAPTTLPFRVTLSAPSASTVSVSFATADGTATAPGDYAATSGTVTLRPGETSATIAVSLVGDTEIEPNEAFTVTLVDPVNARIADGAAVGTITNDDVAPSEVPVAAGNYRGATQDGNYVFLTVLPNRTLTGFRVNDLPETCDGPFTLRGGVDWTENVFTIRADGSFAARGSWTGSVVSGDAEFTSWSARLEGRFTGTSVAGTVVTTEELNYRGTHYRCSSGDVRWSASLQG